MTPQLAMENGCVESKTNREMADVPPRKMGVLGMKAKSHIRREKFLAILGTQARFKSEIHILRAMNSHGFAILDEPSMVRSGSFYCWQLVAEVLLYEFSSRSQPEDFKANSGIGREKGVKKSQSFAADGNHVDDADDAVAVVDDYYYSYVIVIIYIYLYIYNYIYK